MDGDYIFALNQEVELTLSGEQGIVIGRAEYVVGERQYLLRYVSADGVQRESWWNETAVSPVLQD